METWKIEKKTYNKYESNANKVRMKKNAKLRQDETLKY